VNFIVGMGIEERKITWISWDNIYKSKEEDMLGIRHIDLFNKVLLVKWKWRLERCFRIMSLGET